jgi:hypothetical protein
MVLGRVTLQARAGHRGGCDVEGRVQGKYYARATAGTTMVQLEPDVAEAFSDSASVNQALRGYLHTSRGKLPIKARQPASQKARRPKSKGPKPARR